jgi:UDP-glucose 4-epimerase
MKVLITGSSGQIGTNLALLLKKCGIDVTGLDVRPNPWTADVCTEIVDLVQLARGNGRWRPSSRPDCLVHLAAWAKVHELVMNPRRALENVEMSFAALEIARRAGCPIILGSSREVYGDIHRVATNESMADFVVAESPYSASKLAGEAFFYSYSRCYGMQYLVFRFSNVYGRYDNDLTRMERVVPLFVRCIATGLPITVYGRDKVLDFTYVDDCTAGIHRGIERLVRRKLCNETINLASGSGASLLELVGYIETTLGKVAKVTIEEPRPGEVTRYVGDITKARQLLDYEPKFNLSTGIAQYISWCRDTGWL